MEHPVLKLKGVIKQLRDPVNGCPWDKVQTHQSLTPYVIEEAYEVVEAIEEDPDHLEEELGDLLLQIFLHAQIASEENRFSIESISEKLCEKLIRRHPHVFGDSTAETPEQVKQTWDAIKKLEKGDKVAGGLLDSLPNHLPALSEANKIGKKVADKNFDWDTPQEVLAKVREELSELEDELCAHNFNTDKAREEVGDLLFTVAQLARKIGFEPELALKAANRKFKGRFGAIERLASTELPGKDLADIPRETLEQFWQTVKTRPSER